MNATIPADHAARAWPLRAWRRRILLFSWFALTAYLAYAKWGIELRFRATVWVRQRACLSFIEPASRVVMETDPSRAATMAKVAGNRAGRQTGYIFGLHGSPLQRPVIKPPALSTAADAQFDRFERWRTALDDWEALGRPPPPSTGGLFATGSSPGRFQEFGNDACVAFLHGRRAAGGRARLVVIHADWFANTDAIGLASTLIEPATLLRNAEAIDTHVNALRDDDGSPIRIRSRAEGAGARLYAGQPDSANAARFRFAYEADGQQGLIEGELRADDTLLWRIISGPLAAP